jgi:DNA-binding NtrC family response regulator
MNNSRKIFLVDDDTFSINLYRQVLENNGYTDVSTFFNSSIALFNLEKKPSVVFLDYQMSDISGIEVLKKIKKFDKSIYVIMISGQEKIKVAFDAIKLGAFDYIEKGDNELEKIIQVLEKIEKLEAEKPLKKPSILDKIASIFKK